MSATIAQIEHETAKMFNVEVSDIRSRRRKAPIAKARQIAMTVAHRLTSYSYPELGQKLGNFNTSTVQHNVKKIETLAKTDFELAKTLNNLTERVMRSATANIQEDLSRLADLITPMLADQLIGQLATLVANMPTKLPPARKVEPKKNVSADAAQAAFEQWQQDRFSPHEKFSLPVMENAMREFFAATEKAKNGEQS